MGRSGRYAAIGRLATGLPEEGSCNIWLPPTDEAVAHGAHCMSMMFYAWPYTSGSGEQWSEHDRLGRYVVTRSRPIDRGE